MTQKTHANTAKSTVLNSAIKRLKNLAKERSLQISATTALEMIAAIRGYRSSNELSAVAKESELDIPQITPDTIYLPDGMIGLATCFYTSPTGETFTAPARKTSQMITTPSGKIMLALAATEETSVSSNTDRSIVSIEYHDESLTFSGFNITEALLKACSYIAQKEESLNLEQKEANPENIKNILIDFFKKNGFNCSINTSIAGYEELSINEIWSAVEKTLTASHFEVQTEIGNNFENTWNTDGNPTTFSTARDALNDLNEMINDTRRAVIENCMTTPCYKEEYAIFAINDSGEKTKISAF